MAGSKRTYMDLHGHATLQEIIQNYLLEVEDEMIYTKNLDLERINKYDFVIVNILLYFFIALLKICINL